MLSFCIQAFKETKDIYTKNPNILKKLKESLNICIHTYMCIKVCIYTVMYTEILSSNIYSSAVNKMFSLYLGYIV